MAQLAEMGVAIPQEFRADMALAGEWQTLSETKIETAEELEGAAKSIGVRKRKHEGDEEGDEHVPEQLVSKGWGSRMKTYPGAQDDDEDLDALLASTKNLKKPKIATAAAEAVPPAEEVGEQKQDFAPVSKVEDEASNLTAPETEVSDVVKKEEPSEPSLKAGHGDSKDEAAPGVVFKKRKPKVMRK